MKWHIDCIHLIHTLIVIDKNQHSADFSTDHGIGLFDITDVNKSITKSENIRNIFLIIV